MHRAYLTIGSNIDPERHVRQAVALLAQHSRLVALSSVWQTTAVGAAGPDFLNLAVLLETDLDAMALKYSLLRPLEEKMGRVRTENKNAPRTMDMDIVIFDDEVIDPALWERAFLAVTFAELLPNLTHPHTGETLPQLAERLCRQSPAHRRPDIVLTIPPAA